MVPERERGFESSTYDVYSSSSGSKTGCNPVWLGSNPSGETRPLRRPQNSHDSSRMYNGSIPSCPEGDPGSIPGESAFRRRLVADHSAVDGAARVRFPASNPNTASVVQWENARLKIVRRWIVTTQRHLTP